MPPRTCSSLFNGPVCCPQCPILNFWAVAALFVKHVFCCWGHHILKKSKWWGMPACALQLGWPQTSDEQSGAMRCRAWLPLLGTQWPLWPKVCAASQPPELHKAGYAHVAHPVWACGPGSIESTCFEMPGATWCVV